MLKVALPCVWGLSIDCHLANSQAAHATGLVDTASAMRQKCLLMQVVKLKNSAFVIDPTVLQSLRLTLEDNSSTSAQLLHCLRYLDALHLHYAELTSSKVGASVKKLRKHQDENVSTLATRLTEKWRDIVLSELPAQDR
jgi:TFIIS helical bundle-like domain